MQQMAQNGRAACSDSSGASGSLEASGGDEDLPSALDQPSGSDGDDARSSDTEGDPAMLANGHPRSPSEQQLSASLDASGTLLYLHRPNALCRNALRLYQPVRQAHRLLLQG